MEHEDFPVAGFEFMNEPATDAQKDIIVALAARAGTPIDRNGKWPKPFSKWDAKQMIDSLRIEVGEPLDD